MERCLELNSVSEFPLVPTDFDPMEYSGNFFNSLESIVPFPSSDFFPSSCFSFFDAQPCCDSFFQDSSLPLLNLHHADSTRFDEFFYGGVFPDAMTSFLHMPDLQSVEHTAVPATTSFSWLGPPPPLPPPTSPGPGEKRCRYGPDETWKLNSFVKSGINISSSPLSGSPAASHTTPARMRRQKIAEKTRSLEKIMPWEKKMDKATLLEEAYKYVKFLEAQIAVLRWMPLESAYYGGVGGGERGGDTGFLRMLNRQQILQVMSNSPALQTMLYTREFCVFSHEQLLSLKMMVEAPRNL